MECRLFPVSLQELSHTGDAAFRISAETLEELYNQAARALTSVITDVKRVEAKDAKRVEAEGSHPDELFINFLREVLAKFAGEEFLTAIAEVHFPHEGMVRATLQGETYNPVDHPFLSEVKAVTYHGAFVERVGAAWEAEFTIDL